MSPVHWSAIVDAARAAARLLPPPFNLAADIALEIARGYVARGCTIEGCPADVRAELRPADIPDARGPMERARTRAARRAAGFDGADEIIAPRGRK